MSACSDCPDMVQGTLVNDVVVTLQQVKKIKRLVTVINRTLVESNQEIVAEIYRLIDLIPHPPLIDLEYLKRLILCPLTAQSIIVETADNVFARMAARTTFPTFNVADFAGEAIRESALLATLDPRALLKRLGDMINNFIKSIYQLINEATTSFGNITGVKLVDLNSAKAGVYPEANLLAGPPTISVDSATGNNYVTIPAYTESNKKFQFSAEACIIIRALQRIMYEFAAAIKRPDIFLMRLAVTSASVSLVRTTCPELYTGSQFEIYTKEMASFSFDGVLPPGLSDFAKPYIEAFAQLLIRIQEWEAAALIVGI